MAIKIEVHKTDTVGDQRLDQANTALEVMDNDLNYDFAVSNGAKVLDNGEAPDKDNETQKNSFVKYCEDYLYNNNYLDNSSIHVVIYHSSLNWDTSHGPAGYSKWHAGTPDSDRDYQSNIGTYAFAMVNAATGNWPYTNTAFKCTVNHEVGHTLACSHRMGEIESIYQNGNLDYRVTPMPTWYVEQPCSTYPTGNSEVSGSLCRDESNSKDACYHRESIATGDCDGSIKSTAQKCNQYISNHSSNLK